MANTQLPNAFYPIARGRVLSQQMTYDASCIGGDYAQGGQSAWQVWDVDKDGLEPFIYNTLGWTSNDGNSLQRVIPYQFPGEIPLYASRINNIQGISSTGKGQGNFKGAVATWKAYRVNVNFEAPTYQILSDGEVFSRDPNTGNDVALEWKRYVQWSFEPKIEYIERKRNCFWFAPNTPGLSTLERKISGTYGATIRLVKKQITAVWIQIPDTYLFSGGSIVSSYSPKQDNGMGKVNNKTFMGYPPGTLRFDGYSLAGCSQPVPPGFLNATSRVSLSWNVHMSFTWFDPQRKDGWPYPADHTGRGHNLVPHPVENNWYPAYLGDNNGANVGPSLPRYEGYDFDLLFQGNS